MKLDFIFLCFLMVSRNLAQHTTNQDQREKQDLSGDVFHELDKIFKTLGLCLERMNAMGEEIQLLKNNAEMVEDKIEDGFKSLGNQTNTVGDKVDLMEDKMEEKFKSLGIQTTSVEDKVDLIEDKMEDRFKSLGNQTWSVEYKVILMEDQLVEGFKSMGNQTNAVEDKVDLIEDEIEDGLKSLESQTTSVEDKVDLMENKMEDGFKSMRNQINSMEDTISSLVLCVNGEPCNCLDLLRSGITKSGVYTICLNNKPTQVYCDMQTDGGGWLVFQRRADGSENFYRGWKDYKGGFGNLTNEFWQGNEDMYQILNKCGNQHELRIDLEDFNDETRYAKYSTFNIENQADNYRLRLGTYSGNAGDSLTNHDGQQFSTFDSVLSSRNCAAEFKGAWWYHNCHYSNLNGLYLKGNHTSYANGVNWLHWKGFNYSLKFTEMKFRPK